MSRGKAGAVEVLVVMMTILKAKNGGRPTSAILGPCSNMPLGLQVAYTGCYLTTLRLKVGIACILGALGLWPLSL